MKPFPSSHRIPRTRFLHIAAMTLVVNLLPFTAWATPAFNWDFQTYYPAAEAQPGSLTSQQIASINQLDANYPTTLVNATGVGLTQGELDEVLAIPAYFSLSRNPSTGALSGRGIVIEFEDSLAQPDLTQPASFNADFIPKLNRLCDLYAKATAAQAPQVEQVYGDLVEHFLDQNYLPGGQTFPWMGNGYSWSGSTPSPSQSLVGWRSLRMVHKLSADKRDLFAFNLAYISGFDVLLENDGSTSDKYTSTDHYYCYFPTAQQALALMSDTPAKWQLMKLIRRGYDISIMGQDWGRVGNVIMPLDGSINHHDGHNISYASYSYGGMLQMHLNWTTAGFTSPYTEETIERMRKGSLAWCFATTGGLNPLHQCMETELLAVNAPSDGGVGKGLEFALKAARLKSAYDGTPIANDLEMAYAAIAKTGVGSTSLPVEWRSITPPSNIDPSSPLYTASLMGVYSHTTNGTSILRGPGQWYASLRGQPTSWRGGESRVSMGDPNQYNVKSMHGSLMLITTGKNGRKPNEVDSGYFRDGWDPSYFANVTCPDLPLSSILYWQSPWSYFAGETNLTGSANLRDSGVWMMKGNSACKSAFMLGNRIVLVSNNITGSGLHTGLIQEGHQTPASEPLVLDGTSYTADGDWTLGAGGNHKIVDAQGNGYFVHAVADMPAIKARRGNQSVTYALPENWIGSGPAQEYTAQSDFLANINNFSPTTANFSKVWFDHGASASSQALEYTVLVKPQAGELDAYASAMASPASAPVVVTKTPKIHRYQDRASGTCAAAVFDASEALQMHDLISVNRPGAYVWKNKDGLLGLSVSSSENENTTAFQMTVKGAWTLEAQEGTESVTVTPNGGNTVVSLSYRGAAPQNIVLRRVGNNSAPTWFNSTLAKINASFGTPFSGSLAGEVSDADSGDTYTFSKIAGPAWLNVAANGSLSGTQNTSDGGVNVFTIRVTDSHGAFTDMTLTISVTFPVSNGTWTNAAGGSWSNGANWSGAAIANGTDKIADFSTLNLAANATVTLDGAISMGALTFGDTTASHNWTLNPSGGLPLTLAVSTGTPTITVNNQTATLNMGLAGPYGLQKSGSGALTLAGANTYTGVTSMSAGTLNVGGNQSAATGGWLVSSPTGNPIVNFLSGSTVVIASGKSVSLNGSSGSGGAMTLNVAGTVINNGSLSGSRLGVLVLNNGANWTQNGSMSIATTGLTFGSTAMTVNAGATFSYSGATDISLKPSGGGSGSASLTVAGGTFVTGRGISNSISSSTGAANITLSNGGTIRLSDNIATLTSTSGSAFNFTLGSSGGVIDTNGFATTMSRAIAGTGGLTKMGAGTLTLSGSNTYTGTTTVQGGTLSGSGTLAGAVNVQSGGTLAPNGTLTINNTLVLAGSAQMELTKTGATPGGDKVSGVSTVTYGGTLLVTHLGPDPLAAGDSFSLFVATTYAGNFSSITLPTLAANLVWDTSKLSVDGSIGVRALPVAVADTAATAEDTAVSIAVLTNDSDADGDALSIQSVTQGAHGTVVIAGNNVSYTPAANWNGSDSFSYITTDSKQGTASATVTVTVNAVNDTPIFTANPISRSGANTSVAYSATLTGAATDVDAGDTLIYSKLSGPAWLGIAANGTLSGTPGSGDIGNNSWAVRVTDSQGATANATLNIAVTSLLPAGWNQADIGSTGVPGSSSENNGTFTVRGSGADIWGNADAFQFSSGTLDGDGEIRARVTSQTNTSDWAKAGVMLRETTGAGSTNTLLAITPGHGFIFQYRAATSGTTTTVAGLALNAVPNNWVRLTRSGTLITAYVSADGAAWTQVGTAVVSMTSSISAGLAVTSHNNTTASTATFDNVNITPFPPPWQTIDIGATGLQGSAESFASAYTVKGAGIIGGTADKFRFVYQTLSGDGEIKVRIKAPQNTGTGARIGVMIRDTLTIDSPFAFMGVDGGGNYYWQRRRNYGSGFNSTAGGSGIAPSLWVRVVRTGSTFRGYKSADGVNWTLVNSLSITMGANISIGLVVSSGDTTTLNMTVFDNVEVTP